MGVEEEFVGTVAVEASTTGRTQVIQTAREKHSASARDLPGATEANQFTESLKDSRLVDNKEIACAEEIPGVIEGHEESSFSNQNKHMDEISYQYLTFKTKPAIIPVWLNGTPLQEAPQTPDYHKYDDPMEWPLSRKQPMTYLAASVNAIAAYASGSYAFPADTLTKKWHISHVAYGLGITVFTTGLAIAPMLLAPLSEINGRRPVFIVSGIVFVVSILGSAVTQSFAGMLLSRIFTGVGASTFSTMVGGILADIWVSKDRNTPMVLFAGATLFGTGLGPLCSGALAQHVSWRWVFYIQIIFSGVLVGLVTIFFKETRGSVLLSRRAKMLNKYYEQLEAAGSLGVLIPMSETDLITSGPSTPPAPVGEHSKPPIPTSPYSPPNKPIRLRYRVKSDEDRASILKMIYISLYRPMHMLVTEPVVFWFSCWFSLAWGVLYLFFGAIPLVFRTTYNFSLEETGFVFSAQCVAAIISTVLFIYQEKWAMKHYPHRISESPEGRLYFVCVHAALFPLGMFIFGWTCFARIHWIVPTIGVALATMGIFSVFLGVFNYSADVYRIYASSALAGIGLCRNLISGVFPLVDAQMFNNMGFQAAASTLGGLGAGLTLVPWVLVAFGPSIRARSRIARRFVEEDEKAKVVEVRDEEDGGSSSEK